MSDKGKPEPKEDDTSQAESTGLTESESLLSSDQPAAPTEGQDPALENTVTYATTTDSTQQTLEAATTSSLEDAEASGDESALIQTAQATAQTASATTTETIEVRIASGADDVEQRSSGSMSLNSSDLEMADDGNRLGQTVGLRFTDIDIRPGSTIVNAYIQFQTDEVDIDPAALTIRAELGEAAAFSSTRYDVTSRTTTTTFVDWIPDAWTLKGEAGLAQRTPDLTTLVQEIIDRDGWDALDAMVFTITGSGERTAEAFEGDALAAPLLHIEVDQSPLPDVPPVITSPDTVSVFSGDLFAVDVEADDNDPATLSFAITGGVDQALFEIDAATGVVQFVSAPDDTAPADADLDNVYQVEVSVTDAGGATDTQAIAVTVAPAPDFIPVTLQARIASGADDVEQRSSGSMVITSSDLEIVDDGNKTGQIIGLRFNDLDIREGSVITAAYIQFQTDEVDTGAVAFSIHGELGEAAAFSSERYDVSSRTTTTTFVGWSPDAWSVRDEAGLTQRTPDLSAIIQEIIDRDGWDALDSMVFMITGSGERTAEAYEGNASAAPLLHIELMQPNLPDVAPVITSPGTVSIVEGTSLAVDVDADDDNPASLSFSITGGIDQSLFDIDAGTGELSFISAPVFDLPGDADADNVYEVEVTATDGGGQTDAQSVSITVTEAPAYPPITFQTRIATSADDIEERASGYVSLTNPDLELVDDSSNQTVGLRFTALDIPVGATITRAYIQFQADETSFDPATLLIEAQDTDDAEAFVDQRYAVSSRDRTDAKVTWTPPEWATVGEAGLAQQTPDLAALLQEIVSRSGWSALSDAVFIITGTGTRVAEAYDGVASAAPLLFVEYRATPDTAERVQFGTTPDSDPTANTISELAAAGTYVGITAAATDPSPLDDVTYSIGDDRFTIDANTGAIFRSAIGTLDHETAPTVDVTVTASSTDGTSDTRVLQIAVSNDPEPVAFLTPADADTAYSRVITGSATGTSVGLTASAADFDAGDDVSYSVTDTRFAIDAVTGVVTLTGTGTFDYYTEPVVSLQVTAQSLDGSSAVQSFDIDVIPATATTYMKFAVAGDWGKPDFSGEIAVADLIDSWNVDFIAGLGDYTYPNNNPLDETIGAFYADYIGDYQGAYGPGSDINRFFPALGNHEYADDAAGLNNGIDLYLDYLTLPDNERYYDYRVGDAHFFVLNSNWREPDGETSTSIQAQWFENAVAASDASVKITYFHHTPYIDGSYDSEFMHWDFEGLGIDLVLAGHYHGYGRILRDDNADGIDLAYITNGLGGADFGPDEAGANLVTVTDYGTLVELYTADGVLRDSYVVEHRTGVTLSQNDLLIGTADDDYLWGLEGNDTLNGGALDDVLIGGAGNDVFVFDLASGNDTVQDFEAGTGAGDILDLTAYGIDNLAAFTAIAQNSSGNVLATLSPADSLTLTGLDLTSFADDDFTTLLV